MDGNQAEDLRRVMLDIREEIEVISINLYNRNVLDLHDAHHDDEHMLYDRYFHRCPPECKAAYEFFFPSEKGKPA